MKKILFFLVILFAPTIVSASVNFRITDFLVDADIDIAGSMNVKELIVIEGTLNGFERDIIFRNDALPKWTPGNIDFNQSSIYAGSSITNIRVQAKRVTGSVDFSTFDQNFDVFVNRNAANLGDSGVFVQKEINNGYSFRMYYPANNERIVFFISYTITNVVVHHNDVAEIFWPFVGNFEDDIRNIQIRLLLPSPDASDFFRVWGHGPLSGEINWLRNDDNVPIGAYAIMQNYRARNEIDLRMTFDKSLILVHVLPKESGVDAFDSILAIEEEKAAAANRQRQAIKILFYTTVIASIVYFATLILLWIYIYIKFNRAHKSSFYHKYYREFIEDYDVEVIDYLFNKKITPSAMSASIMNLIYKKNVEVTQLEGKKKEYSFKLLNDKKTSSNEKYLIKFLFEEVGTDNTFTIKQLQKYASSSKTCVSFTTSYETWKNKVITEGIKQNFFESNTKIKTVGILYGVLGILITVFAFLNHIESIFPYIIVVPAIIFIIYIALFSKRTKHGNDHFVKWRAFRRFLLDFSILPKREVPEVIIWERYMVYATVLGVAQKVQKAMNVRIKEFQPQNTIHTPMFMPFVYLNLSHTLNTAVGTAVRQSVSAANAASTMSSGGGFGGGFSGGGGGGFGGGGGGRGF